MKMQNANVLLLQLCVVSKMKLKNKTWSMHYNKSEHTIFYLCKMYTLLRIEYIDIEHYGIYQV